MAKYLDEAGLRTLWTKIKGTFVAQTIKKSDSSNATQITHDGDTVSLSRGTISGTGNTSIYTSSASIDIGTDDIITFTSTSRPQYRVDENHDLIAMAFLRDIPTVDTALSSDSINPVQNKVVTSALNGKSNTGHTHSYNDLTDKPTIGNAKITIRQNGTEKGSFTLNQTSPKTIDLTDTIYSNATTSSPGLMSAADKTKLDGIATGATKITVDTALSSTSINPVQNKAIYTALGLKADKTTLDSYFDNVGSWHEGQIMVASGQGSMTASGVDITDITTDIIDLKNTITGLSGAMHFKGKFDSLPAVTNYSAGDVCIIGTKEYVLNDNSGTKTWVELGDEGTHINKSIFTAKCDIIYASGAGTPTRLGIGTNGKVLKVVSGVPSWADDINTHNAHVIYSGKNSNGTDISSGTASSGNITLGDSGITAGSYGDASNQTPSYGGTFNVPSITVNAKGIVTGISTHTVKIPASDNTNTAHSHSAGVGLTGSGNAGTSGNYTYKVNLRDEHVASNSSTYTAGGSTKFYAVQLDKDNKLSVYVPWTDNNTTYTAGTGLSLSGTTFNVNTNYTTNGKNYAVKTDSNKNLYVNVPWVNTTDHSHSNKTILDNFEGAISTNYINALS